MVERLVGYRGIKRQFLPRVRIAHFNDANRIDFRPRWVDAIEARGSPLSTQRPELALGRDNQVRIERVGTGGLGLDLAALLPPQSEKGSFVISPMTIRASEPPMK